MASGDPIQQMQKVLGRSLRVASLEALRRDAKLYRQFRNFILSLTPAGDNRHGILSWWWIRFHTRRWPDRPLCFDEHAYFYEGNRPVFLWTALVNGDAHFLNVRRGISGLWFGGFLVNRDFRGRGLGRLALEHIEMELKSRLREQGTPSVRLNLFGSNEHALNLYKSCGYQPCGKLGKKKTILFKEIQADQGKDGDYKN